MPLKTHTSKSYLMENQLEVTHGIKEDLLIATLSMIKTSQKPLVNSKEQLNFIMLIMINNLQKQMNNLFGI